MNPLPFFREAYQELRKSTWLSRQQAVSSTAIVIILCAILAAFTGTVDMVLSVVLGALLGR